MPVLIRDFMRVFVYHVFIYACICLRPKLLVLKNDSGHFVQPKYQALVYVDQGLFNFRHYMHAWLRSAAAFPTSVSSQTSHCCKYEKELGTRQSVTVYALTVRLGA